MEATVKLLEGFTLVGKADSGHWVAMDHPGEKGAPQGASSPLELLLIALGGCTAMFVAGALNKTRKRLTSLTVRVTAEKVETVPQMLRSAHIHYVACGPDLTVEEVRRVVQVSNEKYCPVGITLKSGIPITYDVEVHNVERGGAQPGV